jgi:hypothetical protein
MSGNDVAVSSQIVIDGRRRSMELCEVKVKEIKRLNRNQLVLVDKMVK